MVKAKFSKHYEAVKTRVRRLPKLMISQMKAHARRDANGVIKEFRDGISNDALMLRRLRPLTIESKARRALESPETPLYGLGMEDRRSYVNMLHVKKVGDRMYVVRPKPGYHHGKRWPGDQAKKQIKLKDLFDVHEYGAVINNAFGRGIVVRIPPRPALRFAYKKYIRRRARQDPAVAVRVAIAKYVRMGDAVALKRIEAKLAKGFETLGGKSA